MKILVVEDDYTVSQTLHILLSSYNYAVDIAADGEIGLQMADVYEYDLMILDIILPKLNGIQVCQQLRSRNCRNPILLLTGQGDRQQKSLAFNAGADDYVSKPFDPEELIARIQALLRRSGSIEQPPLTWGELCMVPGSHRVTYGSHLLAMTPKEYAILELLLRNPQRIFSSRAILNHVWTSIELPSEEAVRVHIKEIRQKLRAAGAPHDWIKTIYQTGYQLNPLYSDTLATVVQQQPTLSNVAALTSVNEQLRLALEELRQTQEALQQQNEALAAAHSIIEQERRKYKDLFDFAPDGYLVTDIHGNIQEANQAAMSLLGLEPETLLGQPLSCYIAADDRDAFQTRLAHREWEDWEVSLQTSFGKIPILITVSTILDQQTQVLGLRWLLRDIHHRKEIEQQLRLARDECELRVVERTAELIAVNHQLQQKEHQWQALFEHALDAIVIANDEGQYVDTNPAACELFGLNQADLLRSSVDAFADPKVEIRQVWQQFLAQGQMTGEFHLCRPDGSTREVEFTAIANFVPERHLAILRDITNRKQLEFSLQTSEAKLNRILDSALTSISSFRVFANRDWEYEYWSAGCEFLFGYTPQELMADKTLWLSRVDRSDLEAFILPLFEDFFAEHDTTAEYRFYHKDGSLRWIASTYASQLIEPNCWMITVVNHDITDRKRAEQQVCEQAALIDIATDAIFVHDLEHRILFWNKGAERLYGWRWAETLEKTTNELFCDQTSVQLRTAQKIVLSEETWQGELEQQTKTGKTVVVASRWTLMRDEAGQPKSVLVVNTDITEKKNLEAQFYRAQRLESVGTLASGIAHDLNNVFTPILTLSQLLRLKLQNLDAQTQEILEILISSTTRGASLVQQILTFSRGTEGKPVPLHIKQLLQETVDIVQQTFPKSIQIYATFNSDNPSSTINSSIDSEKKSEENSEKNNSEMHAQSLWQVCADPTHLHQVMMNLCVNARDAMPTGGVLSLSAQNQFINEAQARINLDAKVGHYVVITVADTGVGIAPEWIDRIFDPFFTTKAHGEGTGLGLSTVLGIVKNYGGFLRVSSQVGEGTQFQVYLPALVETPESFTTLEKLQPGEGELILVVDDEIMVQQTNQTILQNFNYRTLVARDGSEAIELYQQYSFEVSAVIVDVMMPNMDGLTFISQLKKLNSTVKILATSGLPSNRQPALSAGAALFLDKPYTSEELLIVLYRLLSSSIEAKQIKT
jgi:PAS domain S-box-containing protein